MQKNKKLISIKNQEINYLNILKNWEMKKSIQILNLYNLYLRCYMMLQH